MATMKAKKGNPFEREIAYNLMQAGYTVNRIDDNTEGIDLLVESKNENKFVIECKFHKGFSWNQIYNIWWKSYHSAKKKGLTEHRIAFVFKANRQPPLVMMADAREVFYVAKFVDVFNCQYLPIPKGYKVWKDK